MSNFERQWKRFSDEVVRKFRKKQGEEWKGWDNPDNKETIVYCLMEHTARMVAQNNPQEVDIALLAMFLYVIRKRKENRKLLIRRRIIKDEAT